MPGNMRDVVGGEGHELVEDEARGCLDSSRVLRFERLDDKLPGDEDESFASSIPLGSSSSPFRPENAPIAPESSSIPERQANAPIAPKSNLLPVRPADDPIAPDSRFSLLWMGIGLCLALLLTTSSQRSSDLIPVIPANEWRRRATRRVTCVESDNSVQAGVDERKPFAEVYFTLDITRAADKIKLKLDQVDFGVRKPCSGDCSARSRPCGSRCETAFIRRMTIEVGQREIWTEGDLRLSALEPHHTPQEFVLQQSSSCGIQIPCFNPRQASVFYQRSHAVSKTAIAYGFRPARKAGSGAIWEWEALRYGSGKELKLDKVIWGRKPDLPIPPDDLQLHRDSFRVEAEWALEPHLALQSRLQRGPLEFDCKIVLHTAVLKSKRVMGLPSYTVATGEEVHFETVLAF